ncbi:MAG: tetratricopeptide repeat protein, partial [Endozoicomonadaceae bacterium]|nr:tetratricopeptide repeat protein [Endozoicomonadaceae bacterium]
MRFKNLSIFVVCILLIQGCGDSADKAQDYLRNGKTYFQKGEYDKARLEFKNALQIDSKLAEPYYYLALIAEKNQNWQGMFAKLSKTIKLVPDHSEALIKLGRLYLLSGGLDEALEQAEKVLKVSSNNIDAITLQGAVFFKQEQLIKAMEMADKALDLNLANVDAVSLKAALLMEQQNFSDA